MLFCHKTNQINGLHRKPPNRKEKYAQNHRTATHSLGSPIKLRNSRKWHKISDILDSNPEIPDLVMLYAKERNI
ncbi:hypothetical protein ACFL1X_05970 [Candidatus Hydrogenedentota bacterium]